MARVPDPSRMGIAFRLSLFYFVLFTVVGVHLPFWPVWLASHGLTAADIGILLATASGVRVVAAPLIAHAADRLGERRRPMIVAALGATAAFALFAFADGFWPILGITVLFSLLWAPLMPLGETLVNLNARRHGLQYGPLRLWGSLSFIVAAILAGRAMVGQPESLILWLILGTLAASAVACLPVPEAPAPADGAPRPRLAPVLADPTFLLLLAATAMTQATFGVYYGFGSIHWKAVGYSEAVIGWLWAEGVIAEIALFAMGGALSRRMSPAALILLGAISAVVRWTVTGLTDALPALVVVQALHALNYGAMHLGAVNFIMQRLPLSLSATAMSVYASVTSGLATGLSMLAAGPLYAALGGRAYLVMAALGVLAIILSLALVGRTGAQR